MYKATTMILHQADGRTWNPGDIVPLQSVAPGIAKMWIAEGIVVEEKKRGRPRKPETKKGSTTEV